MSGVRIASIGLAVAGSFLFAGPSFALAHLQGNNMPHGGFYGGHPGSGQHMAGHGGCGCSGSSGGSYGHSGGGYNVSRHVVWTGHVALGTHLRGLHFYGMGGGYMQGGQMWSGGYSHGGWQGQPGIHPLGIHYYGMSGGSLAARYGRLMRPVEVIVVERGRRYDADDRHKAHVYGGSGWNGGMYKAGWSANQPWNGGAMPHPGTWSPPPPPSGSPPPPPPAMSSRWGHGIAVHVALRVRFSSHAHGMTKTSWSKGGTWTGPGGSHPNGPPPGQPMAWASP